MADLVCAREKHLEVLDAGGLAERAAMITESSPATRRTYASVYRAFCNWLGEGADLEQRGVAAVQAWRDGLKACGAAPATKHHSAIRFLAAAVDADPAIRDVRAQRVATGQPRALTRAAIARLLRKPDARTRQGKRDHAISELFPSAGFRLSELCALAITDVDERRRAADGALRRAVADSTASWVTVRYAKRGRARQIPLTRPTREAIGASVKACPTCDHDLLFCSLPRTGRPPAALAARDVARTVARHAAAVGLPEDRRPPHVLRHTYCTHVADGGTSMEVIRELAGHADIRITMIYTAVDAERLEQAVADAHDHRATRRAGVTDR